MTIPQSLAGAIARARSVAVLTGAGVSAESGVPTFRDAQTGLWAQFDPQKLATPDAFRRNPKLVWDWYAWRRKLVAKAEPNAGHRALAVLEGRVSDFALITQNVDGLHRRAGSRNVVELHGNIGRVKCSRENTIVEHWTEVDVVWFEETLPPDALQAAEDAARRCQILLVVGTSAEVYPAAALPAYAKSAGATIVEINPNPTPLSDAADYVLRAPAGAVLPALVAAAWPV
jgi:NAD-dependent deacetylase